MTGARSTARVDAVWVRGGGYGTPATRIASFPSRFLPCSVPPVPRQAYVPLSSGAGGGGVTGGGDRKGDSGRSGAVGACVVEDAIEAASGAVSASCTRVDARLTAVSADHPVASRLSPSHGDTGQSLGL